MTVFFETATDMIRMARRNMRQDAWDYVCGAAESETSLRRNRMALDSLAFRPRICRDVSEIDTSTSLFGHKLRIPVILAPMGSIQNFADRAALEVDDAARDFGSINFISTVTEPSLEELAANSAHPKCFQIYVRGDDQWIRDLCKRIVDNNYPMVTLTVDSAFYGNRERLNPSQLALRRVATREWQKKITWDTVKLVKDAIGDRPLILKGIQTAEDAALCVENGVDGVYISNHGGRQLDGVPAPVEVIGEIADAVGDRLEIILDGGVRRGSHVLRALALGATACMMGRPYLYGLAAGGQAGVERVLALLRAEIERDLILAGRPRLGDIDRSLVRADLG